MEEHQSPPTKEDKLDTIILHLERMDRRDRIRTWGGFVRGIIGVIPVLVLLGSIWYFAKHGDELMLKLTQQAAEQAAKATQNGADGLMEQFQQYFPK